jgi:hypothetical protein
MMGAEVGLVEAELIGKQLERAAKQMGVPHDVHVSHLSNPQITRTAENTNPTRERGLFVALGSKIPLARASG